LNPSALDPNFYVSLGGTTVDGNTVTWGPQFVDKTVSGFTVEMGSLWASNDPCGHTAQPLSSGTLFQFTVDKSCYIALAENAPRGGVDSNGVVMEDTTKTFPKSYATLIGVHVALASPVPNVVNMKLIDANTAIIAAGFTVGAITDAYSDINDVNTVMTQNPAAGTLGNPGDPVAMLVSKASSCFSIADPNYGNWDFNGRPTCWCYPRQCHGDADGKKVGNAGTGYTYVNSNDIDIMSLGWMVKDPTKGAGILGLKVNGVPVACADFSRTRLGNAGTGYTRINSVDIDLMSLYWMVKEQTKGTGTPDNCLPGNRNPLP